MWKSLNAYTRKPPCQDRKEPGLPTTGMYLVGSWLHIKLHIETSSWKRNITITSYWSGSCLYRSCFIPGAWRFFYTTTATSTFFPVIAWIFSLFTIVFFLFTIGKASKQIQLRNHQKNCQCKSLVLVLWDPKSRQLYEAPGLTCLKERERNGDYIYTSRTSAWLPVEKGFHCWKQV